MSEGHKFTDLRRCEHPFNGVITKGGKIVFIEVSKNKVALFDKYGLHHSQKSQLVSIISVLLNMVIETFLNHCAVVG